MTILPLMHCIRPRKKRLSSWLAAVMMVVFIGQGSVAQSTSVLFQHGINSDESTWQPVSEALATTFNLTPVRITTGSRREYEWQTEILRTYTTQLPSNAIGVGHSNGGIVLRDVNRAGRGLRGIVTIGTAHAGAGIAQSLINGDFGEWIHYLTSVTAAPVLRYQQFYDESSAWRGGAKAARWWNYFGTFMGGFADAYGLVYEPLLTEMSPGSVYRDGPFGLNSYSNKLREATAVPNRVGIVSSLSSSEGVVFRSFQGQSLADDNVSLRTADRAALTGAYFYYSFYDQYDDPYYGAKVSNAYLWQDAANALLRMDIHWCYNIGAWTGPYPYYVMCTPSDAIVPAESQVYPIGTLRINVQDVSHNEETSSGVTYNTLRDIFESGPLAIPHRGSSPPPSPPPPQPLLAVLSGPSDLTYDDWGEWNAIITGGTPPYRITWSGSIGSGTDSSFGTSAVHSGFLYLSVLDASGTLATSSIYVTVTYY